MALRQGITLKQTTSLALTTGLREAIELTRMTAAEVEAVIAREAEANPLLDVQRSSGDFGSGAGAVAATDWTPDIAETKTLSTHLTGQIALASASSKARSIATHLVGELDDDGYLRVPLPAIADHLEVSLADVEEGLAVLQSCEPSGIAARSLSECFARQLDDLGLLTENLSGILKAMDVQTPDPYEALTAAVAAAEMKVSDVLTLLRRLDPMPGQGFDATPEAAPRADVLVEPDQQGGWKVSLNPDALPKVLMTRQYDALVSDGGEAATYIKDCTARARWLIRALDRRAQSVLSVASEIARIQSPFFQSGVSAMRPLTMREVAATTKLHESTISRVARGKYMLCQQGLFELRYFFNARLQDETGSNKGHAARAVQHRIRDLIAQEPRNQPLSDDNITEVLGADGIGISRRTVAKYRKSMNIPSSFIRRKRNRFTDTAQP